MTAPAATPGVYADLRELVGLRYRARGYSFLPRQPVHSVLAGRHASRLRGRGLNFEEIRRYLPGDDIRTMDWHVTARTRQPHVRIYSEERDRPVLLLVDQRQGMFFGSRRAMKAVVAAEVAALAAWRVLATGDRVGALVFDDADVSEVVPQRSEQQVLRILHAIVTKNHALRIDAAHTANRAMLNRTLERALRLASHDHLVVVVTDGAGTDADTGRLVTTLGAHNDVLVAFVYDPLEAALPDAGRLVMADGDRRLEVDTTDAGLRSRFQNDFAERRRRVHELLLRRQIPVLPLDTQADVVLQLRSLLGRARAPRRG